MVGDQLIGDIASSSRTRADREYEKALSHKRLVKFLKRALPILGVLIILSFVGVSYFNTVLPEGVVIASSTIEDGKIVMNEPVLAGQTGEKQPYRMKAARAVQEIGNTSVITLEQIEAELPMNGGEQAFLKAEEGIFNQVDEKMTFNKPIEVTTTSGMTARFQSGLYDIANGSFTSEDEISIKLDGAEITADKISMSQNGQLITFENNVKMNVSPSALKRKEDE